MIKINSIYPINRPLDLYGYYTKISLVVLPLDVLNLCVLRGIVLLKKYAHMCITLFLQKVLPHDEADWLSDKFYLGNAL